MGHIISKEGVKLDLEKLDVMVRRPLPSSIKGLRGFLGLTGYYRKFIKSYAQVEAPLTDLLHKDHFIWSDKATTAFVELKRTMLDAPVLLYPNFEEAFTLEIDACETGIGAILMQNQHPIVFYSSKISPGMAKASTYAKELYAITQSMGK